MCLYVGKEKGLGRGSSFYQRNTEAVEMGDVYGARGSAVENPVGAKNKAKKRVSYAGDAAPSAEDGIKIEVEFIPSDGGAGVRYPFIVGPDEDGRTIKARACASFDLPVEASRLTCELEDGTPFTDKLTARDADLEPGTVLKFRVAVSNPLLKKKNFSQQRLGEKLQTPIGQRPGLKPGSRGRVVA